MPCAIVQKDLVFPSVDQLKRAFHGSGFLTEIDASMLCRDAFGILVKDLEPEQANLLQGRLRQEGVETEIVDQRQLPPMPPGKTLRQLVCRPEALALYDPLGREFCVDWRHVWLIAAGCVYLFSLERPVMEQRPRRRIGLGPLSGREIEEGMAHEAQTPHLLLEIVLTRGVQRFSVAADRFAFACLGERRTPSLPENFTLLVRDLIRCAPHATLNQGARLVGQEPPQLFHYPSKNAFYEEILWLLYRMRASEPA